MNRFLNKAHHDSQKPKRRPATPNTKPRIPMGYVHTREYDVFYDLSRAGLLSLPQSIRHTINARRSNAKARITTDQNTNNTIAEIVKVRIADLDVYSPNTTFDYRVTVSLEASLEADWRKLVEPTALNMKCFERKKDRMSFKHLTYQIDLTHISSQDVSTIVVSIHL